MHAVKDTMTPRRNIRTIILVLWAVLLCFVIVGELLPSRSAVMVVVGRLQINDKVEHFCAYVAL